MEKWKYINGSSEKYKISSCGKVWSKFSNRELSLTPDKNGYINVSVILNGKRVGIGVHRLVGIHFLEGYKDGFEINHKDANKSNNCAENLEWGTHQHNMSHVSENRLNKRASYCCSLDENREIQEIYVSIADAVRGTKTHALSIFHLCEGDYDKDCGIRIRYYDLESMKYIKTRFDDEDLKFIDTSKQSIRCVETNQIFRSQMEASRNLKIRQPLISGQLSGKIDNVCGYTFVRVSEAK